MTILDDNAGCILPQDLKLVDNIWTDEFGGTYELYPPTHWRHYPSFKDARLTNWLKK